MEKRYWLVLPNGGRQLIDPKRFDLASIAEQAGRLGGQLVMEADPNRNSPELPVAHKFDPPVSAVGPLFRARFDRIHDCRVGYKLEVKSRATVRVLGGYYKRRQLVRVYSHDRDTGRRPLEDLFDTFLHEMAHHLEYTEPDSFDATFSARVRGRMHSALFWRIFGWIKQRWSELQTATQSLNLDGSAVTRSCEGVFRSFDQLAEPRDEDFG